MSIAGGVARAFERAAALGCETMQIFTSNPRGWQAAGLKENDIVSFREKIRRSDITPVFAHMPYLANLAAGGAAAEHSCQMLIQQMERCRVLGVGYLIAHVGKRMGAPEAQALRNVAANVNRALAESPGSVMLLLENTAGMGSEVGYQFAEVATIISMVEIPDRVGFCLDTAHAFAAGYDWRTRSGTDAVLKELDSTIGIARLHVLHLNDSKSGCGSHVDRHWHIGKGEIGGTGIANVVNHPLLSHLPAVMETPRQSAKDDSMNMRAVRRLIA